MKSKNESLAQATKRVRVGNVRNNRPEMLKKTLEAAGSGTLPL
ncbi:hypothetical protein [Granulicella sp. S190]|nr:hypothetical protein [Granulicella sp. S190]